MDAVVYTSPAAAHRRAPFALGYRSGPLSIVERFGSEQDRARRIEELASGVEEQDTSQAERFGLLMQNLNDHMEAR